MVLFVYELSVVVVLVEQVQEDDEDELAIQIEKRFYTTPGEELKLSLGEE